MDYARFNYVAQPGDRGVKLTPPDLGVYDEFVINWLYSPVYGVSTIWEEAKMLETWVDEKVTERAPDMDGSRCPDANDLSRLGGRFGR